MATVPDFTALPATKDISGADIPIPLSGDADYRATPQRARGNTVLNATDYGVTMDGTTDDTAAVAALFADATATKQMVEVHFPLGDCRILSTIDIDSAVRITGEGIGALEANRGTRLVFENIGTGVPLFELTNGGASYYEGWGASDISFHAAQTVANQHLFQIGGVAHAVGSSGEIFNRVVVSEFGGYMFNIDHTLGGGAGNRIFSSSAFRDLILWSIGGFNREVGGTSGSDALGNPITFENLHVKSWSAVSSPVHYFDFGHIREAHFRNTVFEGAGAAGTTSIIHWGADNYLNIDGFHYEMSTSHPTYNIQCVNDTIGSAERNITLRDCDSMWLFSMKLQPRDRVHVNIDKLQGSFASTTDIFDESSGDNTGVWGATIGRIDSDSSITKIDPRHIGKVDIVQSGDRAQHAYTRTAPNGPIVDFQARHDGWFTGLLSGGLTDKLKQGSEFLQVYLNASAYSEAGIVDDPDEGRVWAIRGTGFGPDIEIRTNFPADHLAADASHIGAIFYASMRWQFRYNGADRNWSFWITGGDLSGRDDGYAGAFGTTQSGTWFTRTISAGIRNAQRTIGGFGDSSTETFEFRLAWFKAGIGAEEPVNIGGGFVNASANQMIPLRWLNDAAPTWGDYKQGDRVDNCLPSVGNPLGWLCTTAGGLATAWAPTSAYIIGDWVENDSGNIYICDQAGTSAGGGGPTGTGADIADNTARWDFHDTEGVFTALANV